MSSSSSSSSSSHTTTITMLNNATVLINRYLAIFIFVFGTVGNILNILVLRQKPFRSNPCSWFFLISSTISFVPYLAALIDRVSSNWNVDFTNANSLFCKVRAMLMFAFPTMFLWLITLATIDRWLASNLLVHRRQKSTWKNAQRGTILVVCLSIILYIQMLICQQTDLIDTEMTCHSKSTVCRLVGDLSFALISILCPLLLMILFGVLTISNVREAYRRIYPLNEINLNDNGNENQLSSLNNQQRQRKKIDRQLLIILFVQVTILTILCLPIVAQRLYSTFTLNDSPTLLEKTIDNFSFNIVLLILYTALGLPFYICTLSGGNIVRKALLNVLRTFCRKILFK